MSPESLGSRRDSHPIVWLGLPVVFITQRLLSPLLGFKRWEPVMAGELGVTENLTVVLLLPAVVLGILIFRRRRELPKGIGWLMLAGGLAALYFAGEECSWGQAWLRFETPDAIARLNDQDEFNLHRLDFTEYGIFVVLLEGFLYNVPRQIMLVGTIVCGIALPLALHRRLSRPEAPKSPWYWLIPNYRIVPFAAMAVLLRLPSRLQRFLGHPPYHIYWDMAMYRTAGECKELYFAAVILLYLWSIHRRMGATKMLIET